MSGAEAFEIGELSRRTGVSSSALRFYERRGLLAPIGRISGRRRYDATSVHRVGVILLCTRAGFGLAEVRALLGRPRQSRASLANAKRKELDETIQVAERAHTVLDAMMKCGCEDLDTCELISANTGRAETRRSPRRVGPPHR